MKGERKEGRGGPCLYAPALTANADGLSAAVLICCLLACTFVIRDVRHSMRKPAASYNALVSSA